MRKALYFICLLSTSMAQAQYYNSYNEGSGTIRLIGSYTHDFPGLNGGTYSAEFIRSFSSNMEGGISAGIINLVGFPRTTSVQEYTKAQTFSFTVYFLPIKADNHIIRTGVGYGFSFYKVRRSFPKYRDEEKSWVVADKKGRSSGLIISAEYEFRIPNTGLSVGFRASSGKAYDGITNLGPFVGLRL